MHKQYVIKFKGFYITNKETKELSNNLEEATIFANHSDTLEFVEDLQDKLLDHIEIIKL